MNRPNSFVPLKCDVIDKCVAEGKTWVNNKCQDKPKATDGCDKVCKGLAGKLSAKNPLQVLREANKQCKDTCTPMMKTACGNLVNKTYQSKKITSAKLKIQNVTNDIHYTCEWSTDSAPSNTVICSTYMAKTLCDKHKDKCAWDGANCVEKDAGGTVPPSSSTTSSGDLQAGPYDILLKVVDSSGAAVRGKVSVK